MLDLEMLILSFAGGMVGAAVGGLPSFVLCGVCAVVGLGIFWATGQDTFLNATAWGPLLGPHIAFVGGVAAAAYAAKKGKLESGGKDIVTSLMGLNSPDVLLVGGVFGSLGYAISWAAGLLGNIGGFPWTNLPSLAIVLTAMIVRLVFGSTGLFGKVRDGDNRWLPSDVAGWLPWQSKPCPGPSYLGRVGSADCILQSYYARTLHLWIRDWRCCLGFPGNRFKVPRCPSHWYLRGHGDHCHRWKYLVGFDIWYPRWLHGRNPGSDFPVSWRYPY